MKILAALLISVLTLSGCATTGGGYGVPIETRLDALENAVVAYINYSEDDPEKRELLIAGISIAATTIVGLVEEGYGKEFFDYYIEKERENLRNLLQTYVLDGSEDEFVKIQIAYNVLTALGVDLSEFDWFFG